MKKFFITEKCVGCSACASDCPAQAIDNKKIPHEINQELCIKCGDCFEICPVCAIEFILKGDFYFDTDSGIG